MLERPGVNTYSTAFFLNVMSDRKKVAIAVVGSLILHVVIIFVLSQASALWPHPTLSSAPAVPEESPPEVTLLDQPPATPPDRQFVRSNDDQKAERTPKDAPFESDQDMAGATEKEGKGKDPLPTQDGKDLPDLAMRQQNYSLDTQGQAFAPRVDPAEAEPPSTPAPTPQPTATPAPSATPEPTATPAPTAQPEELAMLRPQSTPAATPALTPVPQAPVNRKNPNQGSPRTAYRPQQILRRMEGNLSTRGRSSVDAVGTPQGRFQKAVQDAVGSRWYYYIQQRSDLINVGTVQISFAVTPEGRVEHARVVSNTSNETLANSSLQSVLDARIPPMPPELAPLVPGSGLEFTFSFNFM
ncbi:MAG TPA: energy transducer TonB [Chthoniobacterales bacterium]